MKFSLSTLLVVALAAESTVASTWFGKAAYNKWHETELERWLSDHNVPYPKASDRKDLENLVKTNWDQKVVTPYYEWDTPQLQHYLKVQGKEIEKSAEKNKNNLLDQVKSSWTDTADAVESSYASVRDWIFDSWTESQLKAFLDKHGIPSPQPRTRDALLTTARENYESVAKKSKETAAYPGNWLYHAWSESDLKAWLDERGIPVPQPTTRDKLIATVRRNSRLASLNAQHAAAQASASAKSLGKDGASTASASGKSAASVASASAKSAASVASKSGKSAATRASGSAAAAGETISEAVFEKWSDSEIKAWADKNGIKVPQGSKRNELLALARKHKAQLVGDTLGSTASSLYGAATSNAGNAYAAATDAASAKASEAFDAAIAMWSDTRLKAYLDSRGVPVPQNGKKDELVAAVRLQAHKAGTGYSAYTFDTWTAENLKTWLAARNHKAAKKADATRQELVHAANDAYLQAQKKGGKAYEAASKYLKQARNNAKDSAFDTWSESDLKAYLDSYGIPTYQGTTTNELRAMARRNFNYFRYGTSTPTETILARLQGGAQWVMDYLKMGAAAGRKEAGYQGQKAADRIKEAGTTATNRAQEAAQRMQDKVKEEL